MRPRPGGSQGGMNARPRVLLTNDDGIKAEGLRALHDAFSSWAEPIVYAPAENNSGVSHHITLGRPLRVRAQAPGWWAVDGTPADCVHLATYKPERPFSLVVSGVNAGANLSYDVHYSGTVGAAFEGRLRGVPAIAVSLVDPVRGSFELAAGFASQLAQAQLAAGFPEDAILNINVPAGRPQSFEWTRLGHRPFEHAVVERRDPRGELYYWVSGDPEVAAEIPGSDCTAIERGRIAVTPLGVDLSYGGPAPELAQVDLEGWERSS